jgi:hypothetical protein
VNWGLLSEVIMLGIPKRVIQAQKSALVQLVVNVELKGMASVQRVMGLMMVRILRNPEMVGRVLRGQCVNAQTSILEKEGCDGA